MINIDPIKCLTTVSRCLVLLLLTGVVMADPPPVTTRKLGDILFYPVRDAPATAVSLHDTRVSAQISGLLLSIDVRVGDTIEKGSVVARLDCRDFEIAVSEAKFAHEAGQAKYQFDKSQLDTAKKLSRKKSISSEEVDRRVSRASMSAADVRRLEAALDAASRSVDKCAIRAPFDAVVIERLASLGDYVVQGSPVVRLLDQENIEVSAKVQEQDLDSLRMAKDLAFVERSNSYGLQLRTVLPLMESKIRSYEVRLTFADDRASPGSAGRLRWKILNPHISTDLLVRRKGLGVFIENNGLAEFVPLENAREGQPAPIDLDTSANVIIDGRYALKHGDSVKVIEP